MRAKAAAYYTQFTDLAFNDRDVFPGLCHQQLRNALRIGMRSTTRKAQIRACRACKARHKKCDDFWPCSYCKKVGIDCDNTAQERSKARFPRAVNGDLLVSRALSRFPGRSELESRTFHRFSNAIAPFLVGIQSSNFWLSAVLPAAHSQDSVFDAALAVEALYSLPKNETSLGESALVPAGVRNQYRNAIDWYRRSVASCIAAAPEDQSIDKVRLLLLTSVSYLHVELRLGHDQNVIGLIRTTFAVIYSAKEVLMKAADEAILESLSLLIPFPVVVLPIDSAIVPRPHRVFATVLALKISSELDSSGYHLLRFELMSLFYDLNDIFAGRHTDEENTIETRISRWYQNFAKYETGSRSSEVQALVVLRCLYMMLRVQWQVHQFGVHAQRDSLEHRLSYILGVQEQAARIPQSPEDPTTSGILDSLIMPNCMFVVWHWRTPRILERVSELCKDITGQDGLKSLMMQYFESLVYNGYEKATDMELELFGQKPKVLQLWQLQKCAQTLAQRARLAELPDR